MDKPHIELKPGTGNILPIYFCYKQDEYDPRFWVVGFGYTPVDAYHAYLDKTRKTLHCWRGRLLK